MSLRIHPRLFLLAIILIVVIQFVSNVIVLNNERGGYKSNNAQLMVVPPPSSYANSNKGNDAKTTATSGTDDTIHPVICNELLKDPTIWDPSKLPYIMLIFFLVILYMSLIHMHPSHPIFLSHTQ